MKSHVSLVPTSFTTVAMGMQRDTRAKTEKERHKKIARWGGCFEIMNGLMDYDKALHMCVCACWFCWYRCAHS